MKNIAQLSEEIHENAKSKGFWDKERNMGEMLMLIVSEISEALEADRKDRHADRVYFNQWKKHGFDEHANKFKDCFAKSIKDTFEDELADAVIRIFDLAYSKGIDLQWHIEQKMRYNATREHMHGKRY